MSEFERKPDGSLNAWIETYEAMGDGENDAEMLCLLLELRRRQNSNPAHKTTVANAAFFAPKLRRNPHVCGYFRRSGSTRTAAD